MSLDSRIPGGPLGDKWDACRYGMKLVNPSNRRKYSVVVVGAGLAGASAAASLAEMGYEVKCVVYQDSPRRAHSVAAQGGINAAKNYQNDGDSVKRLFFDTVKGGDYRSREANVYRLAQLSGNIIDQCVAQGVPFARDYGGSLANRSFGGAQVSRTFYARGQTGQQLLLGAYSALCRQVKAGRVRMYSRCDVLDLVVSQGVCRGVVLREQLGGELSVLAADVVVLATGGYSNVFYLSTNAKGCNVTAIHRAYRRGALFANPCFTQIHPTCIPAEGDYQSKLTLMSESLRNDGRIWVPKGKGDARRACEIPEAERDYYLENKYPSFGNLVPRDVASRNAKAVCDEGKGVGNTALGVYLDFSDAISRDGRDKIADKYGNLFEMYERISGENPYEEPMRIYPAPHYTMGGLWVDYHLMSNIPGLFVVGEANFSDHGANRLGASALMQGLADGYFVLPYTLSNYIAERGVNPVREGDSVFKEAKEGVRERIDSLFAAGGTRSCDYFHRKLGALMRDNVGMSRDDSGLRRALEEIPRIREEFKRELRLPGKADDFNQSLERALRVEDFLEFAELMVYDALSREESCGGHFREESQTEEGEALRRDGDFSFVSAWEFKSLGESPILHKEELDFEVALPSKRNYK